MAAARWELALDQMFRRSVPRAFVRYPEHVQAHMDKANGLYLQLASTTIYQAADASRTDREDLLNTNLNFVGGWQLGESSGVSWWLRSGRPVGDSRDANLSSDIGSVLDINASLENDGLYVREAYWAGAIGRDARVSFGIVDSSYRYDFNDAANDEGCCFLSNALVNSPAIPFPEPGLVVDALWDFTETTGIHAGFYQASCDGNSFICIRDLDLSEVFLPIEVVHRASFNGLGAGHYRLLGFYSDTKSGRGSGVSISIDQAVGRLTAFLRYSVSERGVTAIDRFLSVGTAINRPFGREWDAIGVGFARGRPSNRELRTETIIESYWRLQLNPFIAVSPNVQVVLDPANNPDENRVLVVGIRLQLEL